MRASTVLVGVTLAVLTPGCAASTEPTEEDLAFMAGEHAPSPPAKKQESEMAVPAPREPALSPSSHCGFEECGTNHNRRVLRLAEEHS